MKRLFIILVSIICGSVFAQNRTGEHYKFKSMDLFYTYNGDTIQGEFTDTTIVNGSFIQYKRLTYEGYDNNKIIVPGESRVHQKVQQWKLIEGQFRNGKRWGLWKFWNDRDTAYSWEMTLFARNVSYKTDTVIDMNFSMRRFYINDSSLIYGTLYRNDSEIRYRCLKGEGCKYWTKSSEKQITSSPFEDLDWTIGLIERGEFDDRIRELNAGIKTR